MGRLVVIALLLASGTVRSAELRGRVTLTELPPPPKVRAVGKDAFACGERQVDESVVLSRDGGLANVVVSLANPPGDGDRAPPAPVLDQQDCRFVPHVVVARTGQKLQLLNGDTVLHNAHGTRAPPGAGAQAAGASATNAKETVFNAAIPAEDKPRTVKLREPGLIEVGCDVGHDWMHAWIHVFDHGYFTVSDADGRFTMELPPGRHMVRVWHERYGTRQMPVQVGLGGADLEISFP